MSSTAPRHPSPGQPAELSLEAVRKVAKLARLSPTPEQAKRYQVQLSTILTYIDRLRALDLKGVEPMASPLDATSNLGADRPGPTLPTRVLMDMAPEKHEPFIRVPKVLGDGGGA